MNKFTLGLSLILASHLSLGANESGHGGNALRCRLAGLPVYQALDNFEGTFYRHLQFEMGDPNLEPIAQVAIALKRFEAVDPGRAALYEKWLASFESEMAFLIDTDLSPVNDWGYLPIPNACQVEQVIWQVAPKFLGDTRYWVNRDGWYTLSKRDQALLILHEICFRDALARGQSDSAAARYWNEMIASSRLSRVSHAEYQQMEQDTRYDRHSFFYRLEGITYSLNLFSEDAVSSKEAVSRCHQRQMDLPQQHAGSSWEFAELLKKTSALASPLVQYIKSPAFSGKNSFWYHDLGGGRYGTYSFYAEASFVYPSSDVEATTNAVLCVNREQ